MKTKTTTRRKKTTEPQPMPSSWQIDEWRNCYPSNWQGVIIPEAMAHPAKYSSRLIRRIYEHAREEGWVQVGDKVIDPFGGVALGGLDAMRLGLHWTGMELEKRFVDLGSQYNCPGFTKKDWVRYFGRGKKINHNKHGLHWCPDCAKQLTEFELPEATDDGQFLLFQESPKDSSRAIPCQSPHIFEGNIALWNRMFAHEFKEWGSALLLNGDSRKLIEGIRCQVENDLAVSSPPYATETQGSGLNVNKPVSFRGVLKDGSLSMGDSDGNLGNMDMGSDFSVAISSPPFGAAQSGGGIAVKGYMEHDMVGERSYTPDTQGRNDGNLANLPDSDFTLALSSPPFLQATGGTPEPKPGGSIDHALYARHAAGNAGANGYGESDGQLSSMEDDGFDLALARPPFADSLSRDFIDADHRRKVASANGISNAEHVSPIDADRLTAPDEVYGATHGQLANDSGTSFWLAARAIVDQVYLALKPGGHAIWVVKGYVKNKAYVDFPDQWRQLCEAAGFQTLHEHHALLVHKKGTSRTLEGEDVVHQTESKSFFRRLAEKKGSPRIDWETVLCMVKPGGALGDHDLVVSSPPYADSVNQSNGANDGDARLIRKQESGVDVSRAANRGGPNSVLNNPQVYGSTPGQLGAMKDSEFDISISSPPYAAMDITAQTNFQSAKNPEGKPARVHQSEGYSIAD